MSKYTYFDYSKKWNNYGKVVDLKELNKDEIDSKLHDFSEGSNTLYSLLRYLYDNNIPTKACCRGGHLSIKDNDLPGVSATAYILFSDDNWLHYLSDTILNNKEIEIYDSSIRYYGIEYDNFFEELLNCFKKKEPVNIDNLKLKLNIPLTQEIKDQGYINALINIGFNENQIETISNAYFKHKKTNRMIKTNKSIELIEENIKNYNEYLNILKEAIEYNNSNCS